MAGGGGVERGPGGEARRGARVAAGSGGDEDGAGADETVGVGEQAGHASDGVDEGRGAGDHLGERAAVAQEGDARPDGDLAGGPGEPAVALAGCDGAGDHGGV